MSLSESDPPSPPGERVDVASSMVPVPKPTNGTYRWRAWFLFVPAATALLVWGPYWIWNLWRHEAAWWRIPTVAGIVFDTAAYLQWLGQTVNGWEIGGHLRWFSYPLRALATLVPGASIAEIWLLSRWISITAALWVGGWAVRAWSGLDIRRSRFISLACWLSFIPVLGLRPGVFSWYLPFGILSFTAPLFVMNRVRERRMRPAIAWSVATIAVASVYSWFFVLAVVWIASIWGAWLALRSRRIFFAALAGAIFVSALVIPTAAAWLTSTRSGILFWDLQLKVGLGFTHLPQITNSFIALVLWVVFFIAASRGALDEADAGRARRLLALQWAWIALLLSWLITPFMGVYIHNDHFRTSVLIASWISLAAWWSFARETPFLLSRLSRWMIRIVLVASILFILNILRKPYAFDHDYLNVLTFSHWFALMMTSWLMLRRSRADIPSAWPALILIGSILIGGVGAIAVYRDEFTELPKRMRYVPAAEWVRGNIPLNDAICSDPAQADVLATLTSRRIFPGDTTLYYRELSADVLRNIRTYASGFDVVGSGNLGYIRFINYFSRSIICEQFSWPVKLLKISGVSDVRIDEIIGCPRSMISRMDLLTTEMVRQPAVDTPAFKALCPWVITSSDTEGFWRLPSRYQEIPISETMSAWHVAP